MCTQHSTAEHTSTPQHNTIALVRDRATATQHRGARHWSAAPHRTQQQARADGGPATPIGAVPRNLRKRRGLQRPRPRANKGGPRLLSFILAPPGVATSSSFSSRTLHVLRNTRNSVNPACLSHGSVTSVSRHAGANDSRCAVWVGSASAGFCHSAISSHSTRESSSCTPSM